ncbi:MAG: recombinase family protein [Bacilli bacterium]|nr:recombinase family protein [Bacilli bacterium]
MNRTYGYCRVSSKNQNLEKQLFVMKEAGVDERFLFTEKESGKSFSDRPQYQILKNALRSGDTLYVTSLDRFGRNYSQIVEEYSYMVNNGINIVILDMPMLSAKQDDDLMQRFTQNLVLQILSFVAETERLHIKERQKDGIMVAKSKGVKFGRKRIEKPSNWNEIISKWKNGEMTGVRAYTELGLKETTFYKLLREEKA